MKKIVIAVLSVLVVLFAGAAWYFSGLIIDGAKITGQNPDFTNEVTAIDDTTISYTVNDSEIEDPATDVYTTAVTGLRFPNGSYLRLAQDATAQDRTVTRGYELLSGPQPAVGDSGQFDWNVYPDAEATGLTYQDVTYNSPLGATPAIVVEPSTDANGTWAIVVHGRSASVREGLRITPLLAERGITTMLINYRDDLHEPDVPFEDGIGNFGYTEWEDLQAAVEYAKANGAQDVLLVGYSMGGAIIPGYLERGNNTDIVTGTILHSPAVSFNDVVTYGAEQMGIPSGPARPLILAAQKLAEMRANIDFGAVEYTDNASTWPVPALVMAASEDDLVPPDSVEAFAQQLPDGEFVMFDGAAHTGEWNTDTALYNTTVEQWLDAHVN